MNLFYQPGIGNGLHHLDEIESKHCTRVLRKKAGDGIQVTDGKGFFYRCVIENPDQKKCTFRIESSEREISRNYRNHIAIAPTKNPDRIEWFVEKAVEVGVDQITFIECQNSERTTLKIERVIKVAISAMKQAQRATLPVINGPITFKEFLAQTTADFRFIAYVDKKNPDHLMQSAPAGASTVVSIGPEGDFSNEELELALKNQFKKVSLGPSRLRTETAGLAACHIINLINEQ